jgi:hypothetical protein
MNKIHNRSVNTCQQAKLDYRQKAPGQVPAKNIKFAGIDEPSRFIKGNISPTKLQAGHQKNLPSINLSSTS